MSRKVPSALLALGLALACATSAQAATKTKAKTGKTTTAITACVKTKTGAVKILSAVQAKKKCAKGSKKVTWNLAGPAGANGKNGANGATGPAGATGANGTNGANGGALQVSDASGRLGALAGTYNTSVFSAYNVLASDGGIYTYLGSGQVMPTGLMSGGPGAAALLVFADPFCQGATYAAVGSAATANLYSAMFVGPMRLVYRAMDPATSTFGPTRAWKFTTTQSTVPASPSYSALNATGGCALLPADQQPPAGTVMVALDAVTPPRDGVSQLTIG